MNDSKRLIAPEERGSVEDAPLLSDAFRYCAMSEDDFRDKNAGGDKARLSNKEIRKAIKSYNSDFRDRIIP